MPLDNYLADRDPNTIDFICGMTDRQRLLFGRKLANDSKFRSEHAKISELGLEFERWVIAQLGEEQQLCKWTDHLQRVGYGQFKTSQKMS